MKQLVCALAISGIVTCAAFAHLSEEKEQNPHAPNAKHPEKVAAIMKKLSDMPVDASFDKIIAYLGLPKDWDGGSVSTTECTMVWNIAPGYHFALNFDPVAMGDKITLVFTDASFSAQKKPGFPPDEFHTIYPYRSRKGMVEK
jgi:hypothetical protein